jgi:DNA-binding NarL/FixJ family response regulator
MPLTILIVDDDLGIRLSIGDYLEMGGYSVIMAENGQNALKMVSQYQPHLIITDVTMPEMDGYELVRQVRRQPAFRLLPVIFLTARTNTGDRIKGYQLGCDAYLPKPFELNELTAVVRNLLERSQMIETEWRHRTRSAESGGESGSNDRHSDRHQATLKLDLTQREQDVLAELVEGLSNGQIGDRLHLSPRTIEKHVSSLLRKTETSNRAELVRFAMDHGLVD